MRFSSDCLEDVVIVQDKLVPVLRGVKQTLVITAVLLVRALVVHLGSSLHFRT